MSGIGFWELIILSLIGLIVLGPKRLPQVANQLGEWIGQAKRMTRVMRRQLEEEIEYYNSYKKNLIQFIIHSCSYAKQTKTVKRIRLTANEILGLQKEICRVELFIYDLKLIKNPDDSILNYLNNKHLN